MVSGVSGPFTQIWLCQLLTTLAFCQIRGLLMYSLVICDIAIENGPFVVDLPMKDGDLLHSFPYVYQRVIFHHTVAWASSDLPKTSEFMAQTRKDPATCMSSHIKWSMYAFMNYIQFAQYSLASQFEVFLRSHRHEMEFGLVLGWSGQISGHPKNVVSRIYKLSEGKCSYLIKNLKSTHVGRSQWKRPYIGNLAGNMW